MPSPGTAAHIETMRASLQMLDLQLDRSSLSAQGIADLKSELDSMRLRLWGIMSAERSDAGPEALERFRLRRALEMMSSVIEDFDKGRTSASHPEAFALEEAAKRLLSAIQANRTSGAAVSGERSG